MPEKKVTVTVSAGQITVDKPSIQVHKAQDNGVKWTCDTSAFTINMPGYTITYKVEGSKHVGVSGTFPTQESSTTSPRPAPRRLIPRSTLFR